MKTNYKGLRRAFRRSLKKQNLILQISLREEAVQKMVECFLLIRRKGSKKQRKILREAFWSLVAFPKRDIVKTLAAAEINVFDEKEICQIYFSLVGAHFGPRDVQWAIHSYETPIHLFANTIAKKMSYFSQYHRMNWNLASGWRFLVSLRDKVAFETLLRKVLEFGLAPESVDLLKNCPTFFNSWQKDVLIRLEPEVRKALLLRPKSSMRIMPTIRS